MSTSKPNGNRFHYGGFTCCDHQYPISAPHSRSTHKRLGSHEEKPLHRPAPCAKKKYVNAFEEHTPISNTVHKRAVFCHQDYIAAHADTRVQQKQKKMPSTYNRIYSQHRTEAPLHRPASWVNNPTKPFKRRNIYTRLCHGTAMHPIGQGIYHGVSQRLRLARPTAVKEQRSITASTKRKHSPIDYQ